MTKFLLAVLLIVALASPAFSRAEPWHQTRICEGKVETNMPGANPDWYNIADCNFDGKNEGKAILDTCGVGNPCRAKVFGEWAVDYYVERVISVHKITKEN
jgi:hypothetical protein